MEKLTVDEMSEESDDPDHPNNLIVHKLPWCSKGLYTCIIMHKITYYLLLDTDLNFWTPLINVIQKR